MKLHRLHSWDVSPEEAIAIQERLRKTLVTCPLPHRIGLVAGADASYSKKSSVIFAGVVVLRFPELELVEEVTAIGEAPFPYVPGLLTFREGPALLEAFIRLRSEPDVVIFDGQGRAHPREMGIAAHMGLWLDRPTVGCAKSRLAGRHAEPGTRPGDSVPLWLRRRRVGVVLRTREGVKPVYVSPGHLTDIESSVRLVLQCCAGYRLPEPTRLAHGLVNRLRSDYEPGLRS